MRFLKSTAVAGALVAAFALSAPAEAGSHKAKKVASCAELNAIDPDNDGSMTMLEAFRAAKATFRKLNKDGDITLEIDELGGRMSAKAFAKADLIKWKGLNLGEYLREVRNRFNYINRDGDRTIECDELNTKHGRLLARLLK